MFSKNVIYGEMMKPHDVFEQKYADICRKYIILYCGRAFEMRQSYMGYVIKLCDDQNY